ncbi:AAA family ATPase [Paenibacillus radicis (ex Gao et al. 2016)]|uniref:Nucleoside kinase n=1 Tax=Paenibacillus radicis (ex Gao et al. 2016) TaxID=1737354 RepID=A0A917M1U7_9BACL|nr:AAA family ATPase [Paenibacillus radicis (ex Gao et al. 2016)]GGG69575.1 hypothetical protein GCM10010918_25950 [Paenibacillus radicis (ex Gao et al. 2016)]
MEKSPIFFVTGASGSGKTTVTPDLYKICSEFIILDVDSLYGPGLEDWDVIANLWIRIANQMLLNQKLTIVCGTYMPAQFENAYLKEKFTPYFIGLFCDDETREYRLKRRGWSDEMVQDHKEFNSWIIQNAETAFGTPMPLINTSVAEPSKVAEDIKHHIMSIIGSSQLF